MCHAGCWFRVFFFKLKTCEESDKSNTRHVQESSSTAFIGFRWSCLSAVPLHHSRETPQTHSHEHTCARHAFLHAVRCRPAQPRLRHANDAVRTFSQLYPDTHTPTVWRRQFEGPHLACLSLPVCSVWPSLFICLIKKSDPPACHDILMADF